MFSENREKHDVLVRVRNFYRFLKPKGRPEILLALLRYGDSCLSLSLSLLLMLRLLLLLLLLLPTTRITTTTATTATAAAATTSSTIDSCPAKQQHSLSLCRTIGKPSTRGGVPRAHVCVWHLLRPALPGRISLGHLVKFALHMLAQLQNKVPGEQNRGPGNI